MIYLYMLGSFIHVMYLFLCYFLINILDDILTKYIKSQTSRFLIIFSILFFINTVMYLIS